MKRYRPMVSYDSTGDWFPDMAEAQPNDWKPSDWVRAEDAEAEIAQLRAVVEALPRCEHVRCGQGHPVATRRVPSNGFMYCDACCTGKHYDMPYADALRALEAK